jgi:hypothetical protein
VEFQPVIVKVNGQVTQDDLEFSVVPLKRRPDTWTAAVTLDGQVGFMVENLDPGSYTVWAKVLSSPELPVIDCGFFTVT